LAPLNELITITSGIVISGPAFSFAPYTKELRNKCEDVYPVGSHYEE